MEIFTLAWDTDNGTGASVHMTERECFEELIRDYVDEENRDEALRQLELDGTTDEAGEHDFWEWFDDNERGTTDTFGIESHKIEVPKRRVVVRVEGGVADVTECPGDVELIIEDMDGQDAEDTDEVCPHCGEKGVAYGAHCNMVDHEDTHISEGYCPEHGLVKTVDDAGIDKCPDCGRATSFDAEEAARFEHQDDEPESNCERCEEPISKEGYARDGNCGGVLCRTCSMKDDALPPDPEGQNDDRAKWAGVALDAFQAETGTDDCDKLGDLLGDLMHWCDRNNQEFEWALDRAREYYRQETLSEPDDDPMDVASTVCPEAVRGSAAWEASGREPMSISPLEVLLLAEKAGVKR